MTEALSTQDYQQEWLSYADQHLLDSSVSLRMGDKGEVKPFELYDVVNKKLDDGGIAPVVVLKDGDETHEMGVNEFLARQVLSDDEPQFAFNAGKTATSPLIEVEFSIVPDQPIGGQVEDGSSPENHDVDDGSEEFDFSALLDPDYDTSQLTVEGAAIRKPELFKIISAAEKDAAGNFIIPVDKAHEFVESLSVYGVSESKPTEQDIEQGIQDARELIESGRAADFLASKKFINEKQRQELTRDSKRYTVRIADRDKLMYVDPDLIVGAVGHDNWAGRGFSGAENSRGEASVSVKESNTGKVTRASIDQITDYAARDTELPGFEFLALSLILTKDGKAVFFSSNAHRVSAAKLRGEPLKFNSIVIQDAR